MFDHDNDFQTNSLRFYVRHLARERNIYKQIIISRCSISDHSDMRAVAKKFMSATRDDFDNSLLVA